MTDDEHTLIDETEDLRRDLLIVKVGFNGGSWYALLWGMWNYARLTRAIVECEYRGKTVRVYPDETREAIEARTSVPDAFAAEYALARMAHQSIV